MYCFISWKDWLKKKLPEVINSNLIKIKKKVKPIRPEIRPNKKYKDLISLRFVENDTMSFKMYKIFFFTQFILNKKKGFELFFKE